MAWEVDWANPQNTGTKVIARNLESHQPRTREWHLTGTGYLRSQGVNTPIYRKDSWEIDWNKRNGKLVLARNPNSKMPDAREWHWVDHSTIDKIGLCWKPVEKGGGRYVDSRGYATLTRRGMSEEDVQFSLRHNLFRGTRKTFVKEHILVAAKKYGGIPAGAVVRHINGIKTDNRPENLVLGTTQENTNDHNSARLEAMMWRERCLTVEKELDELKNLLRRYTPDQLFDGAWTEEVRALLEKEG